MPRKEGQKLKLLTLLEIFVRETDEKHPISVPRMVELLKETTWCRTRIIWWIPRLNWRS